MAVLLSIQLQILVVALICVIQKAIGRDIFLVVEMQNLISIHCLIIFFKNLWLKQNANLFALTKNRDQR